MTTTSAYTAARSLVSLQRLDEAAAIFRKLSEKYPTEPRPRGDMLDAELDLALTKGDVEAAVSSLEAALAGLPETFGESVEGRHLRGRVADSPATTGRRSSASRPRAPRTRPTGATSSGSRTSRSAAAGPSPSTRTRPSRRSSPSTAP